jgi:hypothetical protein
MNLVLKILHKILWHSKPQGFTTGPKLSTQGVILKGGHQPCRLERGTNYLNPVIWGEEQITLTLSSGERNKLP